MSEFNFKAGDKVYYPSATNKVLTVSSDMRVWYLGIDAGSANDLTNTNFRPNGRLYTQHHNPAIFPATQEWYDKLVHVYPDLEKPPVKKDPKDIIQAMLDNGWRCVPCILGDLTDKDSPLIRDLAFKVTASSVIAENNSWSTAIPFDPKTGKSIVDYVDGEVVLEG